MPYKFLHALPCDLPPIAHLEGIELSVMDELLEEGFSIDEVEEYLYDV